MAPNLLKTFILFFCFLGLTANAAPTPRDHDNLSKIDILFVVDNSGSMNRPVLDFISNLPTFISKLESSGVDYHIGVTATDAYLSLFSSKYPDSAKLKDGSGNVHSGIFIVSPLTPEPYNVLAINLNQGISGSGDERAFSSFREVLNYPGNSGFRRPEAALTVVVLSDEDDFSHKKSTFNENYNHPDMIPVAEFAAYLKSIGGKKSATFSAISILTNQCKALLGNPAQKVSRRYNELADLTGGLKQEICDMKSALATYADFAIKKAKEPAARPL